MRTAAIVIATSVATLAAVHITGGFDEPAAPAPQSHAPLLERLDRLEQSMTRLADARVPGQAPPASSSPSGEGHSVVPVEEEKRRQSAMRAGNAVVEQIVNTGQFSIEDDAALTAAIAELDGEDQVAVLSRLSMAINDGRVQVRRPGG